MIGLSGVVDVCVSGGNDDCMNEMLEETDVDEYTGSGAREKARMGCSLNGR